MGIIHILVYNYARMQNYSKVAKKECYMLQLKEMKLILSIVMLASIVILSGINQKLKNIKQNLNLVNIYPARVTPCL